MSHILTQVTLCGAAITDRGSFTQQLVASGLLPTWPTVLLKFTNVSVCEVFGYQLAALLDVPVPRAQGAWTDETDVPTLHEKGIRGRIGLLVEYLDDWRPLTREEAIALDQRAAVRAVALCVFDRHEWGEFGVSGGKVYFVDLERLLPFMVSDELLNVTRAERHAMLRGWLRAYRNSGDSAVEEVLDEAARLGVKRQVEGELRRLCSIGPSAWQAALTIRGHRLAHLLSGVAANGFAQRRNAVARHFGVSPHPVPAWE